MPAKFVAKKKDSISLAADCTRLKFYILKNPLSIPCLLMRFQFYNRLLRRWFNLKILVLNYLLSSWPFLRVNLKQTVH